MTGGTEPKERFISGRLASDLVPWHQFAVYELFRSSHELHRRLLARRFRFSTRDQFILTFDPLSL